MPSINNLFIDVYTSGIPSIDLYSRSFWNDKGYPIIEVFSSGNIPEGIVLKTLLFPSGFAMDTTTVKNLLSDSNSYLLEEYISQSGYYHGPAYLFESSGLVYTRQHEISLDHQNTYYKLGYMLYYALEEGEQEVYLPQGYITGDFLLAKQSVPQSKNINIDASLYSDTANTTDLRLRIYRTSEITNYTLSDPSPYLIYISGIDDEKYYDPSGNIIDGIYNGSNYFNDSVTSGMYLSLPYTSGSMEAGRVYGVSLINVGQDASLSPEIRFETSKINTSSDDFNEGNLESFTNVSIKRIGDIPIKDDTVVKKRLMVGIEDIGIVNEQYSKNGVYISQYYNLDNPVYTYALKVGETIPDIVVSNGYNIIKYYVQFHNQEWIRISPVTRGEEYDGNALVPKLLVLDKLNLGEISTQLAEIPYEFSVYSFRVKIEIDMNSVDTANFISPSVLYYESHVTDRDSLFRI